MANEPLRQAIRGSRAGLTGVEKVIENLRRRKTDMGDQLPKVMLKAATRLLNESKRLVPVEYGPLKASAGIRTYGSRWGFRAAVVYTAAYAAYVHEAVAMKLKGKPRPSGIGVFWDPRPRARAKFLEEPSRRLRPELLKIIKEGMRIR